MTLRALILGSGSGIGASLTQKLQSEGYAVATLSRSAPAGTPSNHHITADLTASTDLKSHIASAAAALGGFPNVIVYNAWAATFPQNEDNWLADISTEAVSKELAVNTVSLYAAAQAAVEGWEGLGKDDDGPRVLIYTGNPLPWINMPNFVSLAMGKSASATLVESLVATYGASGKRFYFTMQVDERTGGVYEGIDGPVVAQVYSDLIQRKEQGGWKISFDKKLKLWES
ncbi:unnamed protein product [Tuber melanosporum]|uniref:(Perigord truffle) hypothetical protein n=1 Tax=Tuber melanosporum (strain Mel28) TaxID=656061 RepID=D5GH72_TUBMM|nr:uncharacterized protein GSTUM_00007777001 [Tuber melanosporum]CAZ83897.1 unnamed protein product [Tuber melanosporum]